MTASSPTTERVRWGAVITYIVAACALAWAVISPLWFSGEGIGAPMALLLITAMMFTPTIATLIVMFGFGLPARGERLRFLGMWPLRPTRRVIRLTVVGWLAPYVLAVVIAGLSAVFGLVQLDLVDFTGYAALIASASQGGTPAPIIVLVVLQLVMIPIGAVVNALAAAGEEVGWRGWLLPALRPLGTWPALVITGVVWGVWHAPVVLLGYNFGRTDLTGVLFMIGGCVAWGILFGWLRLRSASVWPAVFAHGMLNAAGGILLLFVAAGHAVDMAIVGPLGVVAWGVLAVVIAVLALRGQFRVQPALDPPRPRAAAAPNP